MRRGDVLGDRLEESEGADCAETVTESCKSAALRQEHEEAVHRLQEEGVAVGLEQLKSEGWVKGPPSVGVRAEGMGTYR